MGTEIPFSLGGHGQALKPLQVGSVTSHFAVHDGARGLNCKFRWTPHPVMVTTKDSNDYVRVLLYSYYTTTTGWGILLLDCRDEERQKVGGPASGTTHANTARVMHEGVMQRKGHHGAQPLGLFQVNLVVHDRGEKYRPLQTSQTPRARPETNSQCRAKTAVLTPSLSTTCSVHV